MARKFHYSPPKITNNILFIALLGGFLWFMEAFGNSAWIVSLTLPLRRVR